MSREADDGPPEPLQNCSITNLTERSFSVECREVRSSSTPVVDDQPPEPAEGSSGGASLVAAVQRPSLLARPAENLVYVLEVYGPPEGSSTQRGVSASQHQVLVRNVSGPEPRFRVGQLWPGTEFEARVFAANSKGRSRPFRLNACTLPPAEALLDKGKSTSRTCLTVGAMATPQSVPGFHPLLSMAVLFRFACHRPAV
ncbi:hypothetical protein HPB51_011376 [Rhipicephalus microplus]|uniref:Fibronectin type-III domain-containing protein n=1 Tax=Rhipicephalus microplus TaxID=6941 RepID=A0A9J6D9N4_RHIMP|nr:hypothetical protein HPB51_011376 [Rhipicephalus microplus]